MKNIVKLFGIIALAAVIGFTMAACKNDTTPPTTPTDTALNGTWKNGNGDIITFNNGTLEAEKEMKGTFTTSGSTITITPTHLWGTLFDKLGLEAKWYSKAELLALASGDDEKKEIEEAFLSSSVTYSVSGNTLTIKDEEGRTSTFTKQ